MHPDRTQADSLYKEPLYLQNLLPQYGAVTLDTAFEGDVTVRFMLRQEQLPPFAKALEEQSAGSLAPTVLAGKYYPFP